MTIYLAFVWIFDIDIDINFEFRYINVSLDIDIINIKWYLFGHYKEVYRDVVWWMRGPFSTLVGEPAYW